MNPHASRILIGCLWAVSVVTAYFLGSSGTPVASLPGSAAHRSNISGSSETENGADPKRAGRVVESFSSSEIRPGDEKNVQSIVARARVEMSSGISGMMNLSGMLRAMAPFADLDPAQLQEALKEVEDTVREPQAKMMLYSLLLGQWAETDGAAAMAYAEKHVKGKGQFESGTKFSVLGSWSRADPDAAWRWFQQQREKSSGDMTMRPAVMALFTGMAARDLDSAVARLEMLEPEERQMAIAGITSTGWSETSRQRLLDRAQSLDPELRKQIQGNVVRNWTMTDPEGAVKWMKTRAPAEQPELRSSIGQMLMMSDPQKGAQLLTEGVAEKDLPRTYDTIVGQWAHRDPKASGEWLTKQPQGAELDNARRTYAAIVAQRDPAAAMDWAKSVVKEGDREASVQQIYSVWHQRNAAAADAALDASGLPPEKIASFREAVSKKTTAP